MSLTFKDMVLNLGQPIANPLITGWRKTYGCRTTTAGAMSQLMFDSIGVDVALATAEQFLPKTVYGSPKDLHVRAFMLHAPAGVAGVGSGSAGRGPNDQGYPGELPISLQWGDGMTKVKQAFHDLKLLGQGGGGEKSPATGKRIPLFLLYGMKGGWNLYLQFSDYAKLEMMMIEIKPLI